MAPPAPLPRSLHCRAVALLLLVALALPPLGAPEAQGKSLYWFPPDEVVFPAGGGDFTFNLTIPSDARALVADFSLDGAPASYSGPCPSFEEELENLTGGPGARELEVTGSLIEGPVPASSSFFYTHLKNGALVLDRSSDLRYSTPVRVDDTANNDSYQGGPAVAADGNGTAAIAWPDGRDGNERIFLSRSTDDGATWGKNEFVELPVDQEVDQLGPRMTFDARGHLHLLWEEWKGQRLGSRLAVSLDGGRSFAPSTFLGLPVSSFAVDGNDTIHLCANAQYYRSEDHGKTFLGPVNMSEPGPWPTSGGCVAADGQGRAHALFGTTMSADIYYSFSTSNGTCFKGYPFGWGSSYRLLVGKDSTPHALVLSGDGLHLWSRLPGREYLTEMAYTGLVGVPDFSAAIDSRDRVHVAWDDGRGLHHAIYDIRFKSWEYHDLGAGERSDIIADAGDLVHLAYNRRSQASGSDVHYMMAEREFVSDGFVELPKMELDVSPTKLTLSHVAIIPPLAVVRASIRVSDDGWHWKEWEEVGNGSSPERLGRHVQLRFALETPVRDRTPELLSFRLACGHYKPEGHLRLRAAPMGGNITSATVFCTWVTNNQRLSASLSNDGGATWVDARVGLEQVFPGPGGALVADLAVFSEGYATPVIRDADLWLTAESAPAELSLDIGADGSFEWSRPGVLDGPATLPSMADQLDRFLSAQEGLGPLRDISVPFRFHSATCGRLDRLELILYYNVPPRIRSSAPPEGSCSMPEGSFRNFTLAVEDPDGDLLGFSWSLDREPLAGNVPYHAFITNHSSAGHYLLRVAVTDGMFVREVSWDLTVENVNRPPVMSGMAPGGALEFSRGDRRSFSFRAADPDGDAVSFFWKLDGDALPEAGNRYLLDTSGLRAGRHVLSASATDGNATAEWSWDFTVREEPAGAPPAAVFAGAGVAVVAACAVLVVLLRRKRRA